MAIEKLKTREHNLLEELEKVKLKQRTINRDSLLTRLGVKMGCPVSFVTDSGLIVKGRLQEIVFEGELPSWLVVQRIKKNGDLGYQKAKCHVSNTSIKLIS